MAQSSGGAAASRSAGTLVMRLPKLSRKITSPSSPRGSCRGSKLASRMTAVQRRPQLRRVAAEDQVGGGRGEDVAAVERRGDVGPTQRRLVISRTSSASRPRTTPLISPLSGSTNHWPADRDRHQLPLGPDPGVDHRQVDRAGRERVDDPGQHERPGQHVLGRDRVADVHQPGPGASPRITPFSAATYGPSAP